MEKPAARISATWFEVFWSMVDSVNYDGRPAIVVDATRADFLIVAHQEAGVVVKDSCGRAHLNIRIVRLVTYPPASLRSVFKRRPYRIPASLC